MRLTIIALLSLIVMIMIVSCGDKGVPPGNEIPASLLQIVSGNNQSAAAKNFLLDSMTVRVVTTVGEPVVGDTVRFTQITPKDSAIIYFEKWPTDALGNASIRYRVDSKVGVDTIMAVSDAAGDSNAVYFQVTVTPGKARNIIKIWPPSGTTPSAIAGEPLSDSVVVQLTDLYDNPTGGARVYFKTIDRCVVGADSSASHFPYMTDSAYTNADPDGLAATQWTLSVNMESDILTVRQLDAYFKRTSGDTLYTDTVKFSAMAITPPVLKYYYNIRPIFEDNCFLCHGAAADTSYRVDYYFLVSQNGNLVPGDTNSPILSKSDPFEHFGNANMVEEDKIIRWVVTDAANPGSSGLNNYNTNMKNIIDASCVTCHSGGTPQGNYLMTTHLDIRGGGSDAVSNAIPGDNSSLVVQKMNQRHNWSSLNADSTVAAGLADSISTWIVNDFMREY